MPSSNPFFCPKSELYGLDHTAFRQRKSPPRQSIMKLLRSSSGFSAPTDAYGASMEGSPVLLGGLAKPTRKEVGAQHRLGETQVLGRCCLLLWSWGHFLGERDMGQQPAVQIQTDCSDRKAIA